MQFETGDDDFHLGVAAASHNFFLVAAVREAGRLQRQSSVIGIRESAGTPPKRSRSTRPSTGPSGTASQTRQLKHLVHLDNTLKDYRREIQRRVFGEGAP